MDCTQPSSEWIFFVLIGTDRQITLQGLGVRVRPLNSADVIPVDDVNDLEPDNIAKIMRYWATRRALKADAYPPKPGPGRVELMQGVGLSPEADMIRSAA